MNNPCIEEIIFAEQRSLVHIEVYFDNATCCYMMHADLNEDTFTILEVTNPDVLDMYIEAIEVRIEVLNGLCEHVNNMLWGHIASHGIESPNSLHTWAYNAMLWLLSSTPNDMLRLHNIEIRDADRERRCLVLGRNDGTWTGTTVTPDDAWLDSLDEED